MDTTHDAEEAGGGDAEPPGLQCTCGPDCAVAEYTCPITMCIMRDPVVAADGVSYERGAIQEWILAHRGSSPSFGSPLPSLDLIPNRNLCSLIRSHCGEPATLGAPLGQPSAGKRARVASAGDQGALSLACYRVSAVAGPSPCSYARLAALGGYVWCVGGMRLRMSEPVPGDAFAHAYDPTARAWVALPDYASIHVAPRDSDAAAPPPPPVMAPVSLRSSQPGKPDLYVYPDGMWGHTVTVASFGLLRFGGAFFALPDHSDDDDDGDGSSNDDDDVSLQCSNEVWRLREPSDASDGEPSSEWDRAWCRVPCGDGSSQSPPSPPPRYHHVAGLCGSTMWIHGGASQHNDSLDDLWSLCLRTKVWSQHTPPGPSPSKRLYHMGTVLDGYLYVAGGAPDAKTTTPEDTVLADVWRIQVHPWSHTHQWQRLAHPLPSARGSAVWLAVPGRGGILLLGGFDGVSCLSDAWFLPHDVDRTDVAWQPVQLWGSKPPPRGGAAVCCLGDDDVYILGGFDTEFGDRGDFCTSYRCEGRCREMCVDAYEV